MPLILPGNVASATAGAYEVANSCRFNDGDSAYMIKAGAAGNRRTFTFSTWIKVVQLGTNRQIFNSWSANNASGFGYLQLEATESGIVGDRLSFEVYGEIKLKTTQVLRDISSWYHVVCAVDSTSGTADNRVRLYLNGTEITSFATRNNPDQNFDFAFNQNSVDMGLAINTGDNNRLNPFDGYLAETVWIDGLQLTPTSFGEFDEDSPTIWKPKDVSDLTFGTNGFYLDYEDSANLGNDVNGGTDLTETNLAATDSSTDTPTNNFCTMNPLITPVSGSGSPGGLSEGNLNITTVVQNCGTFFINKDSTSKWYWECKVISGNSSGKTAFGFSSDKSIRNDGGGTWAAENTLWLYSTDGSRYGSNAGWTGSAGATYTDGDIIGMALDLNGDSMTFYKNGSSQFTISSLDISGTAIVPWVQNEVSGCVISVNFGNPPYANSSSVADGNGYGAFEYAVPSGHYALCTKNLAEFGG